MFVDSGKSLRSHDDVPDFVRNQLIAEEQQHLKRRLNKSTSTVFAPINITNVLPSSHTSSITGSLGSSDPPARRFPNITSLDIPGPRDIAVRSYYEWQQSNVIDDDQKKEYRKAGDIKWGDGLDLEQVSEGKEADLLIQNGLKRGVAWRFVNDIPH
jgi:hypothetical protein